MFAKTEQEKFGEQQYYLYICGMNIKEKDFSTKKELDRWIRDNNFIKKIIQVRPLYQSTGQGIIFKLYYI